MPPPTPKPRIDTDQFIKNVLQWGASLGIGSLAAGAVGAGLAHGVDKAEKVLSRGKNRRRILELAPELGKLPKRDFDAMYETIERAGFAGDRLYAAEAMKRMHQMPESVVGLLPEMIKAKGTQLRYGSPSSLGAAIQDSAKRGLPDLDMINM